LWPVVHGETTEVTAFQELLKYSSTSNVLVIGLPWLLIQKYRLVGVSAMVSVVTWSPVSSIRREGEATPKSFV
jgi:hypothetical protein